MECSNCGTTVPKLDTLDQLPDPAILPEYDGAFSIVKPGKMTNLFPNAAPMLISPAGYSNGQTGVTPHGFGVLGGGSLGFTSLGRGCGGGFAHTVDPATGANGMYQLFPFPPDNLEVGKKYIWCVDVDMEQGAEFQLDVVALQGGGFGGPNGGTPIPKTLCTSETFYGSGCCQRVCCCFDVTNPSESVLIEFQITRTDGVVNPQPWYVSAWTLTETKNCNPVTFFDGYGFLDWGGADYGDITNPEFNPTYQWDGLAFGSSSTKGRWTRSAGELVNLKDCGFRMTGWSGLGMPLPRNIRQGYAKIDGSYGVGRVYDEHDFSLTGRIMPLCDSCNDQHSIDCARAKLIELIADCSSKFREPLIIRYQPQDECGRPCGCPVEIVATYEGGLEGLVDNCIGEDVEIRFNMATPCVRSAARTGIIGIIAINENSMQQNPDGTWLACYTPAYCNNGSKPTPFTWVFSGSSDGTGSFCVQSIVNEDTGDIVAFDPPVDVVGNQQVAVNTSQENPFALHYDFDTGVVTDLSDRLAECSNLSGMELVCGINHFTVKVDKIIDPDYDPLNQPTQQHVPPFSRLVFREQYWGISEACCDRSECKCNADDVIAPWDFAGPI